MARLDLLLTQVEQRRAALHRRKCLVCRRPVVVKALVDLERAARKDPEKYRSTSFRAVYRWSGADKVASENAFKGHLARNQPWLSQFLAGGAE